MKVPRVYQILLILLQLYGLQDAAAKVFLRSDSKQALIVQFTIQRSDNGDYLKPALDGCGGDGSRAVEHFVEGFPEQGNDSLWEMDVDDNVWGYIINHVSTGEYLMKGIGSGKVQNQVSTFGFLLNDIQTYRWQMGPAETGGGWLLFHHDTEQYLVSDETGAYLSNLNRATRFNITWQ